MKSNVSTSQIRLLVRGKDAWDSVSKTGVPVDLYVNRDEANLWKSKSFATSWLNAHLRPFLPHINISSIIVSCNPPTSQNQLCLLLPTLNSTHLALKRFHLDHQIKVSTTLSLTTLENPKRNCKKCLSEVAELIRKLRSYIVIDTTVDGVLSMGDQFTVSLTTKAESAMNQIADKDIPIVLNVRSSIFPSASEIAGFREKLMESMKNKAQIKERIHEILVEISPMEEYKQKELNREEEQIFPSSRRELLNKNKATLETKTTIHDIVNPPLTTNPVTTPLYVPPTNPTPLIVTIPSTPSTFLPVVPGMPPFNNPVTTTPNIPVSTPVTINPANPATPGTAVTVTNPVTTYTTPVATPIMVFAPPPPITTSPVVTGQSWCVAKMDAPEAALQAALDYACGIGGADCTGIQQAGSCYNPNTLRDHASYAFNSYYQKNPVPSSCDFGGIAATVGINPSKRTIHSLMNLCSVPRLGF
ncbi:hypothetical protein ACLOJK_022030 [Asimina triloba]